MNSFVKATVGVVIWYVCVILCSILLLAFALGCLLLIGFTIIWALSIFGINI